MADKLKVTEATNRARALFDLTGRVAVITGGAGLLGTKHAEIIAAAGGAPVLLDLPQAKPEVLQRYREKYGVDATGLAADITQLAEVERFEISCWRASDASTFSSTTLPTTPRWSPAVPAPRSGRAWRTFPLEIWNDDLRVGLTGAFLCSRVFGSEMAKRGKGVILNIASDLAVIAPDQRLYRQPGVAEDRQPSSLLRTRW
jgi:NAD(P)-dependent dehydrogenase (short-subunit alcohol dehydrogenase family)